jgi:hypothetical protein
LPRSSPEKNLKKRVDGRDLIEYNTHPLFGTASGRERFWGAGKKLKKKVDESGWFG